MDKMERIIIATGVNIMGHQIPGDILYHLFLLGCFAWYLCYVSYVSKR